MKLLFLTTTLLFNLEPSNGFGIQIHGGSKVTCSNRFEYRDEVKNGFQNCSDWVRNNRICGEAITVAYSLEPPYVFLDHEKEVKGILPDMIRYALEACCFGCNNLTFVGPFGHLDKFYQKTSIVIPVQTSKSNTLYFGHDFVYMYEIKAVNFIGPKLKRDPSKMAQTLFRSVLNTWPVFVTALVMAMTAGVAIWLLDTRWNDGEFPHAFPKGPFEGFWWAFISMTTVGYGDKSPKSFVARIFAIIWIIIGITIFSIYTATLTSALTSSVIASREKTLTDKRLAVLHSTNVGKSAVIKQNIKYKVYESISEVEEAIHKGEVDGLALDENIANYYMEKMKDDMEDLTLYQRIQMTGNSYGMFMHNHTYTSFMKSYFETNDDQRDIMAIIALDGHTHSQSLQEDDGEVNAFFTASPMFFMTLVTLVVTIVILTAGGLFIKWVFLRLSCNKSKSKYTVEDDGEAHSMTNVSMLDKDELLTMVDEIHEKLKARIKKRKQ